MRRIIPVITTIAMFLMGWGCNRSTPAEPSRDRAEAPAPTKAPAEDHAGHDEANVGEEQARATSLDAPETVGQAPSDDVPLVAPAEILADPERFAGTPVRFQGTVKGFCVHARAWYAVDVPGGTPPYIRVLTAPAFRVPAGVMNASVITQGIVEVQAQPADRIQHFEEQHRLGSGDEPPGTGEVNRVVIRATGATFTPAR